MPPVVMTNVIPSASNHTKALVPRIVLTSDDNVYFAEQSYGRGGVRDGAPRRFS